MIFIKAEVIKELERELALRRYVYGRQVQAGKLSRAVAEHRIAIIQSIIDDYELMIKNGIDLESMRDQ